MSETNASGLSRSVVEHLPQGEALRKIAHGIVDRLPECELKAAVIALEELEVSARVRMEAAAPCPEPEER